VHRLRLLLLRLPVRRAAVSAKRRFGVARQDGQVTFCAGGPEKDLSKEEFAKYARTASRREAPACAEMCSTKALLGGDGDVIADIYRQRVMRAQAPVWGWAAPMADPKAIGGGPSGPSR